MVLGLCTLVLKLDGEESDVKINRRRLLRLSSVDAKRNEIQLLLCVENYPVLKSLIYSKAKQQQKL